MNWGKFDKSDSLYALTFLSDWALKQGQGLPLWHWGMGRWLHEIEHLTRGTLYAARVQLRDYTCEGIAGAALRAYERSLLSLIRRSVIEALTFKMQGKVTKLRLLSAHREAAEVERGYRWFAWPVLAFMPEDLCRVLTQELKTWNPPDRASW